MLTPRVSRPPKMLGGSSEDRSLLQGIVRYNPFPWTLRLVLKLHILVSLSLEPKESREFRPECSFLHSLCRVGFCLHLHQKNIKRKKQSGLPPSSPPLPRKTFFLYEEVCRLARVCTHGQRAHTSHIFRPEFGGQSSPSLK